MTDEIVYFEGKQPDRTYISKSFQESELLEPEKPKYIRILSKVFDQKEHHEFAKIKKEVVLRITPGERQEIKISFYEDSRNIKSITIQRFTRGNGNPHKSSFSFHGEEIKELFNVLKLIQYMDLKSGNKERFDDKVINDWLMTVDEKKRYFINNLPIVEEIMKTQLTKSDVIALAYRKNQLDIFKNRLRDDSFFQEQKRITKKSDEEVWQEFFECNPWIFGYGLNFIFTSHLDKRKLEQITSGYSFSQRGKRVDALMKTLGFINSLCFVEIKTHKTSLLAKNENPYRPECWQISNDLSGSIAQIQKTVQKTISEIKPKIEFQNEIGNPTGETAYLYNPKSYIVIGSLEEFSTETGINEQKFSSFEIFRRNIINPEILTFDELYERAKCIVEHSEKETDKVVESIENGLPF
jgi:hypothetical protein